MTRCVPCTLYRTVCTVPQQYASSNRGCTLCACNMRGVLPPCRLQHLAKACCTLPSSLPTHAPSRRHALGCWSALGGGWSAAVAGAPSSVFAVCKITLLSSMRWARVRLSSLFITKEHRVLVHGRSDSMHAFRRAYISCCTRTSVLTAALLCPRPYGLHAPWCALQAAPQQPAAHCATGAAVPPRTCSNHLCFCLSGMAGARL